MENRCLMLIGLLAAAAGCAKAGAATASGTGGSVQTSAGTGGSGVVTASTGGTNGGSMAAGGGFTAVSCDKASTATTTITFSGATTAPSMSSTTTYYADIPVAGLQPTAPPAVRALACAADLSIVAQTSTGYTVTTSHSGDADPGGPSTCSQVFPTFAPGHIYLNCGYTAFDGSGAVTSSNKFSKVYVSM